MNRLLLVLNIAAAGAIVASKSSDLLTAISPYGGRMPAAATAPVPLATADSVRTTPPLAATVAVAERP